MGLKPIKKKRLFEEIIVALEKYIKDANIKPGDKLPSENELVSLFNVSKTAVREAMSVLNANGIIETRSGSGIYLKDTFHESIVIKVTSNLMKVEELRDIFDFRRGLEVEAVRLAALRGTEEQFEKIRQAHEKLVEVNQLGGIGVEEDYQFHYEIIVASHNAMYKEVFITLSNKLKEALSISKMQSMNIPELWALAYEEHQQIVDALFARNPEEASLIMRTHLIRNQEKIIANMQKVKE